MNTIRCRLSDSGKATALYEKIEEHCLLFGHFDVNIDIEKSEILISGSEDPLRYLTEELKEQGILDPDLHDYETQ